MRRFGLLDWTWTTKIEDIVHPANAAEVDFVLDSRRCVFTLYRRHPAGATRDPMARQACHEVLHILLLDLLKTVAVRGSDTHGDCERLEHGVIQRLLNVLCEPR